MSTIIGNWLDASSTSNLHIQTYVKGFIDMSGGNVILRNNSSIYGNTGDISMGGRLLMGGDASLNSKLFVNGDASFNNRVLVGTDVSLGGRMFIQGTTFQTGDVSMNSRLYVAGTSILNGDASFNNRVLVGTDVSLGGRMFIQGTTFQTGDVSMNSRLYVAGISILNGDVSVNSRVLVSSDVSLGGRLFVSGNTELSGNLLIKGGLTVQQLQNQNIINTTTSNYQLIVSEDLSLNGRLFASGDVSLNSRLYVAGISIHVGDASFNNRVLVGSDVSLGGRLFVKGTTELTGAVSAAGGITSTGTLINTGGISGAGAITTSGTLSVTGSSDASFNNNVLVGSDVSLGGRLFVQGAFVTRGAIDAFGAITAHYGLTSVTAFTNAGGISGAGAITTSGRLSVTGTSDASFNNRVLVGSDVSLGGRIFIPSNSSLIIGGVAFTGSSVFTGGTVANDISLNTRLFVGGDVSMNSRLYVAGLSIHGGDASFNTRVLVGSDVSLGGRLFVQGASQFTGAITNTGGISGTGAITTSGILSVTGSSDASFNNRLLVGSDVSLGGRLFVQGASQFTGAITNTGGISGAGAITTTGILSVTGSSDASFNNRLLVGSDVSLGGRLFVKGTTELTGEITNTGGISGTGAITTTGILSVTGSSDASFNNRLLVGSDVSLGGRLFVKGTTELTGAITNTGGISGTGAITTSGILSVTGSSDASFNNRLLVGSDVSLGGRLFVKGTTELTGAITNTGGISGAGAITTSGILSVTGSSDASFNNRLLVGSDVSLGGRLFVKGTTELTGAITNIGGISGAGAITTSGILSVTGSSDASFNNRLLVGSDVSLGGRLFVKGTTELTGAITNTGGISGTGAITTTGILSVTGSSDASFNNRLLVGSDVSLGGRLFVSGNTELSGNLLIKGGLTVQQLQNQNIINTTTTNYQLIVSEDISLNGRLFATGDTSLNSRLYVAGTSTLNGDASFNSRVLVSSDVSLGGRLFVQGATYLSSLMVNGNPVTGGSSSTSTTSTDNWVLTNLVNPPPAIVFGNTVSTSTGIYVPWTYPTQVNVGFLNLYLPVLSKFSSTYTAKINGSVSQNNPIVTDLSGSSYINPNNGTTPQYITGIVLTNVESNTGVRQIQFPQDANGTLRYAYVYYHANFNTLTTDPSNIITAWYSNNSTSTNKSTVNFNIFLAAGPPSAPGQPTFGTQSISSGAINVNVNYTAPTFVDASNTSITTTAISSYKITYSTTGSTIRYNVAVPHTPAAIETGTTALTRGLTGLFPDCSYTVFVSAKNNSSYTSYGPNSIAGSLSTTNLLPTSMAGTFSFSGGTTSAKLVSSPESVITSPLYLSSSTSTLNSATLTSPIHAIANRGSTAAGLLDISASLTRGGSLIDGGPVLTYAGYPANTSYPGPATKTANFITINGASPTDSYGTNYQQGFYLQASTTVTLGTACFTASNQLSTVNLIRAQKNSGTITSTNSTSFTYYYDTLTGNPTSVSTLHYLNGAQSSAATQVSGIWVLNGNTGVPITGNVTASNMGQYFFKSGTIINYTAGSSSVNESSLTNLKSTITNNAFDSPVRFSNTGLTYTSDSYSKTIPFSATAYNLIGGTNATASAINAIVDYPSINLINNVFATSIQPITANTGGVRGYRVYSGVPQEGTTVPTIRYSGASYYTIPYQNTWSIVSTTNTYSSYTNIDASSELMVAQGRIRSFEGNYMIDYAPYYYGLGTANTLNYSAISQSGYRYATFVWAVNSSSGLSGTLNNLNVYLNGVSNNGNNTVSTVYADSTNKIQLFYRVEDTTSADTASLSAGSNSIASYWISINDNTGTTSTASGNNYFTITTNPYFTAPTVTNGSTVKVSAALAAPIVSGQSYVSNGNIYIYVRLGLPMNTSYNLTSISAYLS